jgi:ketosteroid isomerase-like protein
MAKRLLLLCAKWNSAALPNPREGEASVAVDSAVEIIVDVNGEETTTGRDASDQTGNSRGSTRQGATARPSPEVARRNVEILKRARAAFSSRDFDALLALISDDMELHPAIGGAFVGATTYTGKDGMRRYLEDIMGVIEDIQFETLSFSAWRDYLIVPNRISGHGTTSGIDIDTEMTFIWRVRDGQLVWGATFFSLAEALEAIGAGEDELELIE